MFSNIRYRDIVEANSHCVPTILQMLVNSPAVKGIDLSHWKVIIGGSALSKGLAKAAQALGITVYTGYGMSETCPVICLAMPKHFMRDWEEDRLLEVVCKTGLPIPLVELEVMNTEDEPLPRDGVPEQYRFVDELPKTSVGKLDKKVLRRTHQ